MGVGLGGLFPVKEIRMEDLAGKKIAIDAFNVMFQFISIVRDRFTGEPLRDSHGNVTSHLSGLFYRTTKMIEAGIEPIYIFDGKPPAFKMKTTEERKKKREEAKEKWKEALEKGEVEKVKMYAQGASQLTGEMIGEAQKLLNSMGVQCIQAPSEGEAQGTYLVKTGKVFAVGTQDWDALMFGSPRVVRNLNISGKKKIPRKEIYVEIKPELVELETVLQSLGINHDQLILMGMLLGTDYCPGVTGYGPKKALETVKKEKTLEGVKKSVGWDFEVPMEDIFDFFKNPPTEDVSISKPHMNLEKVKEILIGNHDFSEERILPTLEKLKQAKSKSSGGLGKFLGK